jgi:hypothetical protein
MFEREMGDRKHRIVPGAAVSICTSGPSGCATLRTILGLGLVRSRQISSPQAIYLLGSVRHGRGIH